MSGNAVCQWCCICMLNDDLANINNEETCKRVVSRSNIWWKGLLDQKFEYLNFQNNFLKLKDCVEYSIAR